MKKVYLFIVMMLIMNTGFAQSARLVLVEEFTGETCGPCASYNPAFNATMNNFPGQVISLKYQNNIPSAGPNFYAYNTTDISNRTTYYSNTYSPHGFIDGNYWNGNVASVTASQFNARTAVTSPFSIEVSHSFSVAHDIIYIHAVITATQAVSNANLKVRTAVAERNVYGYTSPNGENEYEHVMRKLLPTGSGTALPSTWAIGDSSVIDLNWTITVPSSPSIDMPIWAMLEGIVWVQDDATKEVMQTGHSPAQIQVDPAITSYDISAVSCGAAVTPVINVENKEISTVTSMDIEYSVDNGTPVVYNWTGSIPQGSTANISLPAVTLGAQGGHTYEANITNVNGAADIIVSNNNVTTQLGVAVPSSPTFTQDFAPTTFPPANWINMNPDNLVGWSRAAASTPSGSGSAKIDFYNSPPTSVDQMYPLQPVDLTGAVAATLTFSVAHQRYSAGLSDKIEIFASSDCGVTWTSIWMKAGANLATVATFNTNSYTPTAAQWRAESINLTNYLNQPNVWFTFKATSGYGNNAYIDNINVNILTGINETVNDKLFTVYPIPSAGKVTLSLDNISTPEIMVSVAAVDGKIVRDAEVMNAAKEIQLDLSNLENGSYFVRINSGNETSVKKIVINK